MTSNMLLPGHSNASVEICANSNYGHVIEKTCTGKSAKRLVRQIEKQSSFLGNSKLRSPEVLLVKIDEEKTVAIMEYVRGSDFISFTNSATQEDFKVSIQILIDFIASEFRDSEMKTFPKETWIEKVETVLSYCKSSGYFENKEIESIRFFLTTGLPEIIRIGKCHGDLTFSNVIVESHDKLCVFDFLDPPLETPYEDAAKFLQDAQFFWSINKYTGNFDKTRVKIYWSYAAHMLRSALLEICDFELLRKFQVLGLLRIILYTKESSMIQFLRDNILQEVHFDLDTSMWRRI